MRHVFSHAMMANAGRDDFVFLTGDLGFMALEELALVMQERFINAGVAEQNMVSVAAGLARAGMRAWTYSIAPFLYARACEQIRNDICLHRFPVILVGNGGGYGYGVMGATHHALEDYGTLLNFPGLQAFVPAFDEDIPPIVTTLFATPHPAYLRLGLSELPPGVKAPAFSPWRKLLIGEGAVIVVVGPLVGGLLAAASELPIATRPQIWLLSQLPCDELPLELLADVRRSGNVLFVEEHVAWSGAGRMFADLLLRSGTVPPHFEIRGALGYPSETYGSQRFHRVECGLDPTSILRTVVDAGT